MLKLLLVVLSLWSAAIFAEDKAANFTVVAADEIKWGYLNPLRGDKSPAAADLWGDRTKHVATGMLVKFKQGFSSPPHIHNVTYRGVVIDGLVHNDSPLAAKQWLPAGSYWTQPLGHNHITAAKGDNNLIFIEIDTGPYLVKPSKAAFDSQERAINVDAANLVWLDDSDLSWVLHRNVAVAFLWGEFADRKENGTLVKLPKGFKGQIVTAANEFRAVVIKGQLSHQNASDKRLSKGSYFGSEGAFIHQIAVENEELTLYMRNVGKYQIR